LHEGDVKTLPKEVFQHIEAMGAPRLVEYWEQDPCPRPMPKRSMAKYEDAPVPETAAIAVHTSKAPTVKIEAKFEVGEYKILILSATDSAGLETWLTENHYKIPADAEKLLRPYVESGMKFFVA
jgi:hypothetical protein